MDSKLPTKMFAHAGPSGELIPTFSVYLYIVSLKLNSTDDVTISMSLLNTVWGMGSAEEGCLYKACVYVEVP